MSIGYTKLLQTLKRQMSLIQLKWFTRVKLSYGIMRARAKGIVNWIGQAKLGLALDNWPDFRVRKIKREQKRVEQLQLLQSGSS